MNPVWFEFYKVYKVIRFYKVYKVHKDQITKCYEPLQKLRVRLGTCKTGFSPPVTLCY